MTRRHAPPKSEDPTTWLRTYRYISGDSTWSSRQMVVSRVPQHVPCPGAAGVRLPDGSDACPIEANPASGPFDLYGGKGRDVWKPTSKINETTPGTGRRATADRNQDIDGIDAEVLFRGQASGPYFCAHSRRRGIQGLHPRLQRFPGQRTIAQ